MKPSERRVWSPVVYRRSECVTRPIGPMGAQLDITRIQHGDRYYEILPAAPPDYPSVAVRIFRVEADGAFVVELNGHLVSLPRAVFEEGPQHPDFRRVAEEVGIRVFPLQHRYWFMLVLGLKDDMNLRYGPDWHSIGGECASRSDQWWDQVEAHEDHLDREIKEGRIPDLLWVELLRRVAESLETPRPDEDGCSRLIEGEPPLFDTSDAGRPN